MSLPQPIPTPDPAVAAPSLRARLSPRAWFRARLSRDPRRWVLALAAAEGLVGFADRVEEKPERLLGSGTGLMVALLFLTVAPALGVIGMLVHGRLLYWSGKLLRGRAAPHQIHAAFAWSQLPLVVIAWPMVLDIALRVVAADAEPVPAGVRLALDLLRAVHGPLELAAGAAALLGVYFYVTFLAEAQQFSAWRALANHLLAILLGLAILVAGIGIGWAAGMQGKLVVSGLLAAAVLLIGLELALRRVTAPGRTHPPSA